MTDGPFSRRTVRWLVALSTVSFVSALALSVFGPDLEAPPSGGTDTYSKAALGHKAFVELLRELDIPVVSSRHASARRAGDDAVLVLAEPHDCPPGSPRARTLARSLRASRRTLLVLPKWRGEPHRTQEGWVQRVHLVTDREVEHVLKAAGVDVGFSRQPRLPPERWRTGPLAYAPSFPLDPVQLLDGDGVHGLVSCGDGVLLAEVEVGDGRLLVLSDPDLLANAGLGKGANAALAVAIVESLRPEGGAVVFDETIHGHERVPSLWRELFTFPLVVLMAQGLVVLLVLLWAGMGRFGSPERPAPPLEPGHRFLIQNTAELLRYRGHVETVLPLYLENTLQGARKALGAPRDLEGAELEAWLDRVAATRGADRRVEDLRDETRAAVAGPHRAGRVLDAAQEIYRWNQEILHGPSGRTEHP